MKRFQRLNQRATIAQALPKDSSSREAQTEKLAAWLIANRFVSQHRHSAKALLSQLQSQTLKVNKNLWQSEYHLCQLIEKKDAEIQGLKTSLARANLLIKELRK